MKLSLLLVALLLPVAESRWRLFNGRLRGRGRGGGGNGQGSGQETTEQASGAGSGGGNQGSGQGSGAGSGGGNQGNGQGSGGGSGGGNQGSGQGSGGGWGGGNKGNGQGSGGGWGGGNKGNGQGSGGDWNGGGQGMGGGGTQALPASTTPLGADEKKDILYMREEEKLARDVYLTFSDMYDVAVFGNIARSEQQHMNRMKTLVDAYDLEDPVVDDSVGEFTHPVLKGLYTELKGKGDDGLLEALTVGALIEEIDIQDLQLSIAESDQSDANFVYERLLRASYNHLRAFVRNIELQGETYEPQKLSDAEFDAIVG